MSHVGASIEIREQAFDGGEHGIKEPQHACLGRKILQNSGTARLRMMMVTLMLATVAAGQPSQQHQLPLKEAHEQAFALGPLPASGARGSAHGTGSGSSARHASLLFLLGRKTLLATVRVGVAAILALRRRRGTARGGGARVARAV